MSAAAKPASRRRRAPWRENIEALVVAIVMAVMLKYFAVEAYKIPTGSMQPTLMGQAFPQGGGIFDRILVDKLSFHLREPRRFEVVVFKYPLDRSKNFVKRLWGLPGEELRIAHGDVWVRSGPDGSWRIPRRPRQVQLSAWKPLDRGETDPQPSWQVTLGAWTAGDRRLAARGSGRARFAGHGGGAIADEYLDGYPEAIRERVSARLSGGLNVVGDLRVDGRVRALPGCRSVAVELQEAGCRYLLELPGPAAGEDAVPRIVALTPGAGSPSPSPSEARGEPWRLPAGRWVRFAAQNLDDRLELEVAGEPVVALEIEPVDGNTSGAELAVEGEGADLEDLQVRRDIYYTASRTGAGGWRIPAGSYFMLGDNTLDSSDSREWTFIELGWRDESGAPQHARGNWRPSGPGGPEVDANPVRVPGLEGPTTWLRDEWGETHVVASSSEIQPAGGPAARPAPFVPRELITGRAVVVFWPIAARLGLWRLGWVH